MNRLLGASPRRPLTICLISEEFPPESGWGGIGSYAHAISRGLAGLGHRVHVIARGWEQRRVEQVSPGVHVHRIPVPEPSWRRGTWFVNLRFPETRQVALWSALVSGVVAEIHAREPIDVIESPEYHAQGLITSVLREDLPMVVRLHTPAFLCRQVNGISFGGSRCDSVLSESAERWTGLRARVVTSPSRALAEDVAEHWRLNTTSIRVIPNPTDEELFRPADGVERDAPAREPQVLFVGRLERRKGVETLIDAWPAVRAACPEARLALVGADHESAPGGTSMKAHLRDRLKEAGVPQEQVTLTGAIDRCALPARYAAAQVCVVPSLYENFPYTCLEAMACGRAVVASRVGGIPEIVTDGVDGLLVPPNDPGALASAITRLLKCPNLRRALGRAARQTILRRFSRHSVCARTAELYRTLVE